MLIVNFAMRIYRIPNEDLGNYSLHNVKLAFSISRLFLYLCGDNTFCNNSSGYVIGGFVLRP